MPFSLAHLLHAALADNPEKEALVVIGPTSERRATRGELEAHARYSAHQLLAHGIQPGDVVLMLMDHAYETVPMFIGALYMGAVPMLLPYLTPQTAPAQQGERLSNLIKFFQPKAILTLPHYHAEMRALGLPVATLTWDLDVADAQTPPPLTLSTRADQDTAYLQFTSGTTGQPKAVIISHNLLEEAMLISTRWGLGEQDVCVGAAPLSHVSGLAGVALGGVMIKMRAIILSPAQWAQQPAILLRAVHKHRATFMPMTNTGLNLSLLRVQPAEIEGIDLSSLRVVSVGAEVLSAHTLHAFAKRFAPYGFRADALKPTYAASEVNVTMPTLTAHWHADWVSASAMMTQQIATPIAPNSPNGRAIVSCGTPLPGVTVEIRDEAGHILPDRALGEIVVQPRVLFPGYWNRPDLTASVVREGRYYTGDMGYTMGEELFVVGRVKDLIIVGGRNLLPDAVEEQAMVAARGLLRGAVAFGVRDESLGTEQPVVVCELLAPLDAAQELTRGNAIRERVRQMLDVALADVRFVPAGWIVRAGIKLSRTANRDKYLAEFRTQPQSDPALAHLTAPEQVTRIFEQILGHQPIGLHDNFFDLGGDSISALKLLLRVEQQFGRSIPPAFFARPTIAYMLELLADQPQEQPTQPAPPHVPTPAASTPRHEQRTQRAWTPQRVREALRRRLAAHAFQQSYFAGNAWLAKWVAQPWRQQMLFPQETQLVRQFVASMNNPALNPSTEIQHSLFSQLVNDRVSRFTGTQDVQEFTAALQRSTSPYLQELGQAIANPAGDLYHRIFSLQGQEHLAAAQAAGRGIILLTCHTALSSLSIVALLKHQPKLYWLGKNTYQSTFRALYGSTDQSYSDLMPTVRAQATQTAHAMLRAGGIVGIAADSQNTQSKIRLGIGNRVRPLRVGFAELAMATDAVVLPTYAIHQLDGRVSQVLLPPLEMGDHALSHEARLEHLTRQAGAFLDHLWHTSPSVLNWLYMREHLQLPKADAAHLSTHQEFSVTT